MQVRLSDSESLVIVFFNSQIYFYVEAEEGSNSEELRVLIIYIGLLAYMIFYLLIGIVILHSVNKLYLMSL